MAVGLLEYSGLVTKTRAMHARLLDREDYAGITEYETVGDVIEFLRQSQGYAPIFASREEIAHRGQVETVIRDSLYMDYRKLYQFAGRMPRKALDIIFFRYEVNVLKNCLEYALKGSGTYDPGYLKLFFADHASFDTEALLQAGSLREVLAAVEGSEYEPLLQRLAGADRTYADYAFELDIYYYRNAWRRIGKLPDKKMRRIMERLIGTELDWLNIMTMYRLKRFYAAGQAEIAPKLIPVRYRIRKSEYQQMLATESMEEFTNLVQHTAYFTDKDAVLALGDEITWQSVVEKTYEQVCRKSAMSVAPVLKYLHDKENEIDLLTTALEGIRYRLPAREIRELILLT